ncbi:hypothetical protein M2137_000224 [Parabacteroides sp. PFB2-10]|nr:hypothetical protein [Parabacteroides sp. PFB2-10]
MELLDTKEITSFLKLVQLLMQEAIIEEMLKQLGKSSNIRIRINR